jgi:hypothetical protein
MKTKLITYLLVLSIALSLGAVQAQTSRNNTSQLGNPNGTSNTGTPGNNAINISEGTGENVRWVPVNENETTFEVTQESTLYSGNFTSINGTFFLNLTDLAPPEMSPSNDTAKAEFNFTDPRDKIKYAVVLKHIDDVAESLFTYNCVNGNSSIDRCTEPTTYTYGTIWGVGELYVNGTLVNDNRIIRIMASERVNSSDKEGYNLLFDKELSHKGIETRLFLPDLVVTKNGTMEKQPVPTNFTLPDGQNQPFINVIFENCQLEGHRIFFNNTSGNMIGNLTGNMENMTH